MKTLTHILIAIFFSLLSVDVSAAEGDVIIVNYKGATAEVTIPGTAAVVSSVNGADVVLLSTTTNEEYVYKLTGSTTNGSFAIKGNYKMKLELAGVSIISSNNAAITVECGKRIDVLVDEGTTNTITDAAGGTHKAAMYFSGHPEFDGSGVLNVSGMTGHAICAKEYLKLKKTAGTINILSAANDGIHCGKGKPDNEHRYFQINGGILNINNVKGDCIDSDDYGTMNIKGGVINANVTAVEGVGLKCDSVIYMSDGVVNVSVTGSKGEGMRACYNAILSGGMIQMTVTGSGAKGIKGKDRASGMVLDGGYLTFDGTECDIDVSCNDIKAADGTVTTNARAVSADRDIYRKDGEINIKAYGKIESAYHADGTEYVTGGNVTIARAPWVFSCEKFRHDMSVVYLLKKNGNKVTDYSRYVVGAFIGSTCVGVAASDNYIRVHSGSTSQNGIMFKVFDYQTQTECSLKSNTTVKFLASNMIGTFSDPIILSFEAEETLLGDVNEDGFVNVGDVNALTNMITGKATSKSTGDVNSDSSVNISDVSALIRLLLGN